MKLDLLLESVAEIVPNRVAVTTSKGSATYDQLRNAARARGGALRDVLRGRPLAFVGTNQLAFPLMIFTASYAGAPFVPMNYRLKQSEYEHYFSVANPGVVVADRRYHDLLRRSADAVNLRLDVLAPEELPTNGGAPEVEDATETEAVLLFTSGTTSAPKLVKLTHMNLVSYVLGTVECASAHESEAALLSAPPYHVAAVANTLSSLFRGRRLVLLEQFDAREWLETVKREAVTHAMVVPTMLVRILDVLADEPRLSPKTLVNLSYGGSRAPAGLVERAMNTLPAEVGLVNAFGLTETSSTIAMLGPEEHRMAFASHEESERARLNSVGHPIPGVEVRIDVDGREAVVNEVGELCIRGPQVSEGYVNGPRRVDEEGWLHTGDLGHVDDSGFLYVDGRKDDLIIRGGENIDPTEIESILREHPAISDALVVGLADEEWGEVVAALLIGESSESDDEIRSWVRSRLAGYKVPVHIRWVDEFPRNDLGKLLRRNAKGVFAT